MEDIAFEIQSKAGDQIFDLDFHPTEDFVALGSVTGLVEVYKFKTPAEILSLEAGLKEKKRKSKKQQQHHQLVYDIQNHTSSCRGVQFSPDGNTL